MLIPTKNTRPEIHGHRGCRGLLPENTLPAFLHALQLGVDALEMDVVLSADKKVIVAHEPWLSAQLGLAPDGQRIDPQRERSFNMFKLPYATIRQSIVGVLPHPKFPFQQQVPTYRPLLEEVLQTAEIFCQQVGRSPVNYSIEIKSTLETEGDFHPAPHEFTTAVLAAISPSLLPRVTLLSFDPRVLQVARQLQPRLRVCLLVENPFLPSELFASLGFVPEAFGPAYNLLDEISLAEIRRLYKELAIIPWTVNQPSEIVRFAKMNVNGITTDYPNYALQII